MSGETRPMTRAWAPREPDLLQNLPTAVRGMFELLPSAGMVFPEAKREAWLTAMRAIFDLIYHESPPVVRLHKPLADPLIGFDFPRPEPR